MGVGDEFTQGRTPRQWLEHMYERWRADIGAAVPPFEVLVRRWASSCRSRRRT